MWQARSPCILTRDDVGDRKLPNGEECVWLEERAPACVLEGEGLVQIHGTKL
jgi:hypothetical protein